MTKMSVGADINILNSFSASGHYEFVNKDLGREFNKGDAVKIGNTEYIFGNPDDNVTDDQILQMVHPNAEANKNVGVEFSADHAGTYYTLVDGENRRTFKIVIDGDDIFVEERSNIIGTPASETKE